MNTNEKTDLKIIKQNDEEPIAEVSATEAEAVAGGINVRPIISDKDGPYAPRDTAVS